MTEIQYWINHREPESRELADQMRNAGIDFASLPTSGPSTLHVGHSTCYGPRDIKYVVDKLIEQVQKIETGHKHQFSCTCCHGATCPLHNEGIKHCIICHQIITDDDLAAGESDEL